MIILKGYKKEAALMVRLKKLSRVFSFTIERDFANPDSSEEEALKSEVIELSTKNGVLESENTTLTENNTQLVSELELSKNEIEDLNNKLDSKSEVKLTAVQVAELIEKVDNLKDLKQYSEDTRQVVELAYKKKLKELELE